MMISSYAIMMIIDYDDNNTGDKKGGKMCPM